VLLGCDDVCRGHVLYERNGRREQGSRDPISQDQGNSAWKLPEQDRRRNLGTIPGGSKELLKSRLTKPRYLESHAPKVIEKAVTHGYVTSCDPSRNRSYADFTADLAQWK
jgi:hypothetical protein